MCCREGAALRHGGWRFTRSQHVQGKLFDDSAKFLRVAFHRAQLGCHRFEARVGVGGVGHLGRISNLLAISLALRLRSTSTPR